VRTELIRHLPFAQVFGFLFAPVAWTLLKSPLEGAQTSLHCALAPTEQLKLHKGKYFADCKQTELEIAFKLDNQDLNKKLWEKSVDLVKLNENEQWWNQK